MPASTALAAVFEPSVGIRMCWYMVASSFEDQGAAERFIGRIAEHAADEGGVLALLRRHLARERTQRGIEARPVDVLEERLRALLGAQRNGERLPRGYQPVDELARRGFGSARIEPLIGVSADLRQGDAARTTLERLEMLGLLARQQVEETRQVFASLVCHALGELAVALGRLALDGDGVRVELGRRFDQYHGFTVGPSRCATLTQIN